MKSVKQLLLEGAERIEKFGWLQGRYGHTHNEGPCCLLGAVVIDDVRWLDALGTQNRVIAAITAVDDFDGYISPAKWNDAPGRTKEEVIAKMRELAERVGDQ